MVTSYVKNMEHSLDIIGLHFLHFRTLVFKFIYLFIPWMLENSFVEDINSIQSQVLHFRTLVSEFYLSIPLEKSFFDDRNSQINDPLRSDQLNKYWSEVMNLCIPVIFHPQSSV